jgi:hypothetical protein
MNLCHLCKSEEAVTTGRLYLNSKEYSRVIYTKVVTNSLEFPSCKSCSRKVSRDSLLIQCAIAIPLLFGLLAISAFLGGTLLSKNPLYGVTSAIFAVSFLVAAIFAKKRGLRYLDELGYWEKNPDENP